jgi:hypothetical protein
MQLGTWDVVLIVAVSLQGTVLAYVHSPRWKAFILSLPIPFTIASLAVDRPIDATNVAGLVLLLVFAYGVKFLHSVRVPIVPAIAAAALVYTGLGAWLAPILPVSDAAFWLALAIAASIAVAALKWTPAPDEPGYRSPLPVWIKLPIIVAVTGSLVLAKSHLRGFVTVFPMVGVVAAYEMRHSLWTVCRQIPVLVFSLGAMLVICRVMQPHTSLPAALAVGWVVNLAVLLPMMRVGK